MNGKKPDRPRPTEAAKENYKVMPDHDLEEQRRMVFVDTSEDRFKAEYERQKHLLAESRNLFDYAELVNSASIPRKVVLDDFGFYIEYCPLTSEERNKVFAIRHHEPLVQLDMRNRKALAMMMQKAMPDKQDIEAKVDQLPATWIDAIMIKIAKEENAFLPQLMNDALRGLNKIPKPRKS